MGNGSAPPPTATSSTSGRSLRSSPPRRRSSARIFRPLQRRGLGLQENRQLPDRAGHPHPPHGGARRARRRPGGLPPGGETKAAWAIVTVQGILDNDFYIGTLRQGKYTRAQDQRQGRETGRGASRSSLRTTTSPSSTTAPLPPPGPSGRSAPPPTTGG